MSDKKTVITVRADETLHRAMRLHAADRNISLGEMCEVALNEWQKAQPTKTLILNDSEQSTPKKEAAKTSTRATPAKKATKPKR